LREWIEKKDLTDDIEPVPKTHTRVFLSSLDLEEKSLSTQAARGHWSIENRNHHKRDASGWQEDRHRHRRGPKQPRTSLSRVMRSEPSYPSSLASLLLSSLSFIIGIPPKPSNSSFTPARFYELTAKPPDR
jgi:hypothetical protein